MASQFQMWKKELEAAISRGFNVSISDARTYISTCGDDVWEISFRSGKTPTEVAQEEYEASRELLR